MGSKTEKKQSSNVKNETKILRAITFAIGKLEERKQYGENN